MQRSKAKKDPYGGYNRRHSHCDAKDNGTCKPYTNLKDLFHTHEKKPYTLKLAELEESIDICSSLINDKYNHMYKSHIYVLADALTVCCDYQAAALDKLREVIRQQADVIAEQADIITEYSKHHSKAVPGKSYATVAGGDQATSSSSADCPPVAVMAAVAAASAEPLDTAKGQDEQQPCTKDPKAQELVREPAQELVRELVHRPVPVRTTDSWADSEAEPEDAPVESVEPVEPVEPDAEVISEAHYGSPRRRRGGRNNRRKKANKAKPIRVAPVSPKAVPAYYIESPEVAPQPVPQPAPQLEPQAVAQPAPDTLSQCEVAEPYKPAPEAVPLIAIPSADIKPTEVPPAVCSPRQQNQLQQGQEYIDWALFGGFQVPLYCIRGTEFVFPCIEPQHYIPGYCQAVVFGANAVLKCTERASFASEFCVEHRGHPAFQIDGQSGHIKIRDTHVDQAKKYLELCNQHTGH